MAGVELAAAVAVSLERSGFSGCTEVVSMRPVNGGSINDAYVATMASGERLFVKYHQAEPGLGADQCAMMFDAEWNGLELLRKAGCFRVPQPLAVGRLASGAFLAMEHIDIRPLRDQRRFGELLAEMHLAVGAERFGLESDNWIGSTPQPNKWHASWVDLLRVRLEYQLDRAQLTGEAGQMGQALLQRLPSFFEGVEIRPSLIHGDLYAGNCAADEHGNPVVYDPAVYWGHHESELGIMHMFGGFSPELFEAYHQRIPRAPGFDKRLAIYQLYHALNHYNLFGSGYRTMCASLLKQALS
ncbi:hypothetical protein LPJ61_004453 [Coemansia biformis]|uniref:protein-ribulosamine 3-kinase n=1 Tax=Coemansia biformis TaxID=1286918 RepID=A0A9W8CUN6_9FUNG|nr:hypothetical protein LPJ61_004453 [Coemansia biformis]